MPAADQGITSALAQKLSFPTLLISDTALVFWYTEPCRGQGIHYRPLRGSAQHRQELLGWCLAQRPLQSLTR